MALFNIKPLSPKFEAIGSLDNFLNWFRDWLLSNDEAHEDFYNFELASSQRLSVVAGDWAANKVTVSHDLSYAPTMVIMGVPQDAADSNVWQYAAADSDNVYLENNGTDPIISVIVY